MMYQVLEEYYLQQTKDNHEDAVKLQKQAIDIACHKCSLDAHVTVFEYKKDAVTAADRIAMRFWHKDMVVKKSFMFCQSLDMTFFFDDHGKATYTYAGYADSRDSGEKLTEAFRKADMLRLAMDEAMEELLLQSRAERITVEIQDAVNDGLLQLDPNNKNNILVYMEGRTPFPKGWYSRNIQTIARDMAEDDAQYREFHSALEDARKNMTNQEEPKEEVER